jgi:hypothetical protein
LVLISEKNVFFLWPEPDHPPAFPSVGGNFLPIFAGLNICTEGGTEEKETRS